MCHYGVIERFGQCDQTLWSVLPTTEQLSCDWTLTSVRSALTGRIRSRLSLSGTLLESTRHWHPVPGHCNTLKLASFEIELK